MAELSAKNSASSRKDAAGIFFGGIIWIFLIFFIVNPLVYTYNINKWFGGWAGIIWELFFISFILAGLYFVIMGLAFMVVGKDPGPSLTPKVPHYGEKEMDEMTKINKANWEIEEQRKREREQRKMSMIEREKYSIDSPDIKPLGTVSYNGNSSKNDDIDVLPLWKRREQLFSENWVTVTDAAIMFGDIAKKSPEKIVPMISILIKDLYSREARVAGGAAMAISIICESNSDILTPFWGNLSQFLNYTDSTKDYEIIAKRPAVYVLGIIGQNESNNTTTRTVISRYLNDKDECVKKNAVEAIKLLDQSFINNRSLK
jgi:hypothetical protein